MNTYLENFGLQKVVNLILVDWLAVKQREFENDGP